MALPRLTTVGAVVRKRCPSIPRSFRDSVDASRGYISWRHDQNAALLDDRSHPFRLVACDWAFRGPLEVLVAARGTGSAETEVLRRARSVEVQVLVATGLDYA